MDLLVQQAVTTRTATLIVTHLPDQVAATRYITIDKGQLIDVLLRLSRLLSDFPCIEELDLNPFLAGFDVQDSCALDMRARIRLQNER